MAEGIGKMFLVFVNFTVERGDLVEHKFIWTAASVQNVQMEVLPEIYLLTRF